MFSVFFTKQIVFELIHIYICNNCCWDGRGASGIPFREVGGRTPGRVHRRAKADSMDSATCPFLSTSAGGCARFERCLRVSRPKVVPLRGGMP